MNTITIYTVGSCQTQAHSGARVGGWAAVLTCGTHRKVLTGSATDTTVNAMELRAMIAGLSALKTAHQTVQLFTDSQYVAKGVNEWLPDWIARGWKTISKKPVANQKLWQQVTSLLEAHTVTVTWVPREQNTEADELAQTARRNHGAETPKSTKQVTHLLIAGSRYASREMLDYTRRAVRRAHERGYTIVVGDNPKGVDLAGRCGCRRLKVPVIVAGAINYPRNGGCKHGSYVKVHRDTYRAANGHPLNRYTVRDRWMADTATLGLFIWNGDSPGTRAGYDYMIGRGKSNSNVRAHLINFGTEV